MKQPRRKIQAEREAEIIRLHLADYSYSEISKIIGDITPMGAHKIVTKALGERRKNKRK